MCEGLVEGIGRMLAKCRKVNPNFCLASEAGLDRMIPYVDVYYRATTGCTISPLRYVFPEWTAVQHVSTPRDFRGINGAVLTGAVICVEPKSYQGTLADPLYRDLARYVREIERIRQELASFIFLGNFYDNQGAIVTEAEGQPGKPLPPDVAVRGPRPIPIRSGGPSSWSTIRMPHESMSGSLPIARWKQRSCMYPLSR